MLSDLSDDKALSLVFQREAEIDNGEVSALSHSELMERLPKEFRFEGNTVFIQRLGNHVILTPNDDPWSSMFDAAKRFSPDFMAERDQGDQSSRGGFD